MQAIVIEGPGGPEQLALRELPRPQPGPGEVLLEIHAVGINRRDTWVRMGRQGVSYPYVPGSDTAGVVVEAGAGAEAWLGRRVLGQAGWGCGSCVACLSGQDPLCPQYAIHDGGYAQYRVLPASQLVDIGDLAFPVAACLPVPYQTAWQMVHNFLQLQPGACILVSGAAGGVGTAAMQVAHLLGAKAAGLTRSAEKAAALRQLGFDEVFVLRDSWPGDVLARWGEVDAVVDTVGPALWEHWPRLLRRGGAVAYCATTTGSHVTVDLREWFRKSLRLHGTYMGPRADLCRLVQLARDGRLAPVIDRTFPLSEAASTHRRMDEQAHVGGLLLLPEP